MSHRGGILHIENKFSVVLVILQKYISDMFNSSEASDVRESRKSAFEKKYFQGKESTKILISKINLITELRIITKKCGCFCNPVSCKIEFTTYGPYRGNPPAWELK